MDYETNTMSAPGELVLHDFEPAPDDFHAELRRGLSGTPKTIPCRFLYDSRGSALFDQICDLPEYYPTRTEKRILTENIAEITTLCGPGCLLVELGSGNSSKTRLMLERLENPAAYVPVDISRGHLLHAAQAIAADFFPLEVLPVCADYNQDLALPIPQKLPERRLLFYPGSTIGNFTPDEAQNFLRQLGTWCAEGDGMIIGIDLAKDASILENAYDDAQGVTAEFNLNLLRRANRELGTNFRLRQFRHRALFNPEHSRIEMHLVSLRAQEVSLEGRPYRLARGESIITEFSYKYPLKKLGQLFHGTGWHLRQTWTDPQEWFSLHFAEKC